MQHWKVVNLNFQGLCFLKFTITELHWKLSKIGLDFVQFSELVLITFKQVLIGVRQSLVPPLICITSIIRSIFLFKTVHVTLDKGTGTNMYNDSHSTYDPNCNLKKNLVSRPTP